MTLLPAYFGEFGGQFVPESLIPALDQLEQAFVDAQNLFFCFYPFQVNIIQSFVIRIWAVLGNVKRGLYRACH